MPFPTPAASDPDDAAFIRNVLAHHAADLPKLVYADWLEERGDPRGAFLRSFVEAARDGTPYPGATGLPQPWLDLMGVTALTACRRHAIPLSPSELLSKALPALRIEAQRCEDDRLPLGASKFGGGADVPEGFEWPMYQDRPLSFLAQFNLGELANSPAADALPRCGLLSVFYRRSGDVFTNRDVGGWRLYHFGDIETLHRVCRQENTAAEPSLACPLDFVETLTFPEHWCWASVITIELEWTYRDEVSQTDLRTQLLGWPRFLQNNPDWFNEGGLVPHLLTLDFNSDLGWYWGDAGLLYFGIPMEALRAGDFSETFFNMQCC